jgi:hypothetical protein
MQPRANVDSERFNLLSNRTSAANPTGWAVKGGKKAVAGRLDLMAAKASKIASDCGMMLVEEITPSAVAKHNSFLCRANDVSKQNRGKNPVDRDRRTRPGQKLLDSVGNLSGVVSDEGYMIFSWKLDIAGARNVLG